MLPYQTIEVFKYRCLIEFVYAYQAVQVWQGQESILKTTVTPSSC